MSGARFKVFQLDGVEVVRQFAHAQAYVFAADGDEIDDYNGDRGVDIKLEHFTKSQQGIAYDLIKAIIQSIETILTEVPDLEPKKLYKSFPSLSSGDNFVAPAVFKGLIAWKKAKEEIIDGKMWDEKTAKTYDDWMHATWNISDIPISMAVKYYHDLVLEAEKQGGDVTKVWDLTKPEGHLPSATVVLSQVLSLLTMGAVGYGEMVRSIASGETSNSEKCMNASMEEMSHLDTFRTEDLASYVQLLELYGGVTLQLADKSGKPE